ncbi:hypothetical protein ALI144C_02895 [Actinosynnema sp. ALI-1.44]|uniref:hypothetical protein n=1 Tax=Actinosynnema sp. ALI-1.44 TaxID=1933779 RepID=UPI00097BEF90|nr:hypothetical protein [Actinosynnema sp. ALI-1.44]ONI90635.1 hypothetical protein ALI144C_02895 [Actinosynnema sp. ALI-1.44]
MAWELSYGWECHVCGVTSFITFTDIDIAVSSVVQHADERHDGLLTDIDIVEVSTEIAEDDENYWDNDDEGDWL